MARSIIVHLEGDPLYHKLFQRELKDSFGDRVLYKGFFDSPAALDYLRGNRVDLVISCLSMEGERLKGLAFLRDCKSLCPDIPFIVHSSVGYRDDFFISGVSADAFIVKSSDPSELIFSIRRLLKRDSDRRVSKV